MTDTLHYVYAVTSGSTFPNSFSKLQGIDDSPVGLVANGDVSALVTTLDAGAYSPAVIEERAGNMDWITPRAVAHDRVVTWASDHSAVIPLPMWTMFSSTDGVKEMLRTRSDEFKKTFERIANAREYSVRVYVKQSQLLTSVKELSARLAELEAAAQNASPGQKYLLLRKLESERKDESRNIARNVAIEAFEELEKRASLAQREQLPQGAAETLGSAILNGVFLVQNDALQDFRVVLTNLINKYQDSGFQFEFTGPWPPYHFVNG